MDRNISIEIVIDGDLEQDIRQRNMPAGNIRIRTGHSEDPPYAECSHLLWALEDLAASIPNILDGKEATIEYDTTKTRFDPLSGNDKVKIYKEIPGLPESTLEDMAETVDRKSLVAEIYRVCSEYYEDMLSIDRNAADWNTFGSFEKALKESETAIRAENLCDIMDK